MAFSIGVCLNPVSQSLAEGLVTSQAEAALVPDPNHSIRSAGDHASHLTFYVWVLGSRTQVFVLSHWVISSASDFYLFFFLMNEIVLLALSPTCLLNLLIEQMFI